MATENAETNMHLDPSRVKHLVSNLEHVYQRIEKVQGNRKVKYLQNVTTAGIHPMY